jgi:hypothetical protein
MSAGPARMFTCLTPAISVEKTRLSQWIGGNGRQALLFKFYMILKPSRQVCAGKAIHPRGSTEWPGCDFGDPTRQHIYLLEVVWL